MWNKLVFRRLKLREEKKTISVSSEPSLTVLVFSWLSPWTLVKPLSPPCRYTCACLRLLFKYSVRGCVFTVSIWCVSLWVCAVPAHVVLRLCMCTCSITKKWHRSQTDPIWRQDSRRRTTWQAEHYKQQICQGQWHKTSWTRCGDCVLTKTI